MIELARDVQEMTYAPVILVGEELLPQKLKRFERVHNRVLSWVLAEPSDIDDARTLANILCPHIEIADDSWISSSPRQKGGHAASPTRSMPSRSRRR